jgi:hypothetical protein
MFPIIHLYGVNVNHGQKEHLTYTQVHMQMAQQQKDTNQKVALGEKKSNIKLLF